MIVSARALTPLYVKNVRRGRSGSRDEDGTGAVIMEERVVDLSGHEPLEATDDVPLRQTLRGATCDVIHRGLMPAHADNHDPVQRRVGLAMAAAKKPVPIGHSTRGGDRAGANDADRRPSGG